MKQQQLLFINAVLAAFAGGIYATDAIVLPGRILLAAVILLLLVSFWLVWREKKAAAISLLLLFFVLGFARCSQFDEIPATDVSRKIGESVRLQGTVAAEPQVRSGEEGENRLRYLVRAEKITQAEKTLPASGLLYVYAKAAGGSVPAKTGDHLQVFGEVKALHGYQNPGRIDTVAAAKRQGISACLHAGKRGVHIERSEERSFLRWVETVRAALLESLQRVMPAADAAAMFAMLFGGYEGIKPELLEAFTATGIVHILSVSGSHISLVAGTLAWLGRALHLRQLVTAVFVTLAIVMYAIFAGCVPPVLRAAVMGLLSFVALVLGRTQDARRILSLVALGMLMLTPRLLYDISFQLSFAATAGLLYLSPPLRDKMKCLPDWLASNLAVTVGAQLSVVPFLAWYFNAVSLSSLAANVLAVPLVEYIIIVGLAAALLGLAAPFLQTLLFAICSLTLGFVYELTRSIAALPGGNVYLPTLNAAAVGFYYVSLGLFLAEGKRQRLGLVVRPYKKQLAAAGLAALLVAFYIFLRAAPLRVHFIDVGQGDAALLITPHGRTVMIDTGGSRDSAFDVGLRVDLPYLRHYGVRQIDYLLLTHAHDDHAGGAAAILRQIPVEHVIIGREDRREYAKTMKLNLAAEPAASFVPALPGQTFLLDGVRLAILHAGEGAGSGNEASSVIKVSYGEHSFLFTGDLTAGEEKKLLAEGADLSSSVLKVAHHGSKTSSTAAFLAGVHPDWAVISVGADNAFGHPSPLVLDRLRAQQIEVLRTDKDGAIVFQSDGRHLSVQSFAAGK